MLTPTATISIKDYKAVQASAKQVLAELCDVIGSDSTEQSIAAFATDRLSALGLPDTWYHSCPAFVLAGSRSCLSISGRDYAPSEERVGSNNLVTVDLSPCAGTIWGDCARSFPVEGSKVNLQPACSDFKRGVEAQARLHAEMKAFVNPDTTFSELHKFSNGLIASLGYKNLDFLGNVGHSIVTKLDNRIFIDANNDELLSTVPLFTFEPHIQEIGGVWGFKHENIYYFDALGEVTEL